MAGTNAELARRILEARKQRRWRRSDLVTYSGLSDNTVGNAERFGKVTRRTAEKLASVLGLDPAELLK